MRVSVTWHLLHLVGHVSEGLGVEVLNESRSQRAAQEASCLGIRSGHSHGKEGENLEESIVEIKRSVLFPNLKPIKS